MPQSKLINDVNEVKLEISRNLDRLIATSADAAIKLYKEALMQIVNITKNEKDAAEAATKACAIAEYRLNKGWKE